MDLKMKSFTVFLAVSFIFKVCKGWDVKTQLPESTQSVDVIVNVTTI